MPKLCPCVFGQGGLNAIIRSALVASNVILVQANLVDTTWERVIRALIVELGSANPNATGRDIALVDPRR